MIPPRSRIYVRPRCGPVVPYWPIQRRRVWLTLRESINFGTGITVLTAQHATRLLSLSRRCIASPGSVRAVTFPDLSVSLSYWFRMARHCAWNTPYNGTRCYPLAYPGDGRC